MISERYIAECKKDMEGMNIEPATKNPKATEEIGGMLDMIQTLIDKGHAYPAAMVRYISGPEASRLRQTVSQESGRSAGR